MARSARLSPTRARFGTSLCFALSLVLIGFDAASDPFQTSARVPGSICDDPALIGIFWGNDNGVGAPNDEPEAPPGGDLWSLATDMSTVQLTDDARSFPPSVSSDGRRVYFGRGPGGVVAGGPAAPEQAWVLDLESGQTEHLFDAYGVQSLQESPDRRHLAYVAPAGDALDLQERLFVANLPGGTEAKKVARTPQEGMRQSQFEPVWSRDGSRLAYVLSSQSGDSLDVRMSIHLLDWQSGGDTELYEAPLNALLQGLHWSPDGRHLLVSEGTLPRRALSVDVVTGEEKVVATDVYQSVVYLDQGTTVSELGIPFEQSEEPFAEPVMTTWIDGRAHSRPLPRTFAFAQDLDVPTCWTP